MATGLRIRVLWDDTLIEDRIHVRERTFVGTGPLAHVATPATEDGTPRYVVLTVRGALIELRVARGVAQSIEFPGEDALDGQTLSETLVRRMAPPYGAVRLRMN